METTEILSWQDGELFCDHPLDYKALRIQTKFFGYSPRNESRLFRNSTKLGLQLVSVSGTQARKWMYQ